MGNVKAEIDVRGITEAAYNKLHDPSFGLFMAHEWHDRIKPFYPTQGRFS